MPVGVFEYSVTCRSAAISTGPVTVLATVPVYEFLAGLLQDAVRVKGFAYIRETVPTVAESRIDFRHLLADFRHNSRGKL